MTFNHSALNSLSFEEVLARKQEGKQNISSVSKTKRISEILIENIFSVFNLIILFIIIFLLIFYFKSDDERLLLDSIGVSLIAIVNTLIAIVQEIKAKRALDKVNLLLKKEAKVIRSGTTVKIDYSEIVIDDLIILERGDQAPVDGKVIISNHLEIDESLLTGESLPVEKNPEEEILSGSFCNSGNGIYIAEKVGDESYASQITLLAKKFKLNLSPLQIRINFIIKLLFVSAILLIIFELIVKGGDFGNIDFVRKISTVLISLVPQGLVLMSSVTFALGIYRISKIGAIIQKLNAIESFSNVQVVCTDKTGTLTQNKLAINQITYPVNNIERVYVENLLGTFAKYSSDKNATLRTLEIFESFEKVNLLDEIPFSSENKMSLLKINIDGKDEIFILGAYDVLLDNLQKEDAELCEKKFSELGLKIYRNLIFGKVTLVKDLEQIRLNKKNISVTIFCIISISDQVRNDVMDAIRLFKGNGIDIKILSGDSSYAVQAVARDIGWDIKDEQLISGEEIDKIDDDKFPQVVKEKLIFARLKPEHKLRIIKTLRKEKLYTAMIGDGVNDLPAIKESDLGIAMEEGSQVTKEIADIILLKNKFTLLPRIFDEGNKIVNTVCSAAKLFLTKNFLVIYMTIFSILFLLEFPLTPRRVSLINLFSIGLPAFIIALKNSNTNKCKNFMSDLFSFVILSALVIITAGYAGEYYYSKYSLIDKDSLQMIMMNIMIITTTANFLSVTTRKNEKNNRLYFGYAILLIGIFVFLTATTSDFFILKYLKIFYEINYLEPKYWKIVAAVSIVSSAVLFILQILRRKILIKITSRK